MTAAERRFGAWVAWLTEGEQADLLRLSGAEPQERWVEHYRKIARVREYVHRLGLKAVGVRAFSVGRASRSVSGDVVIDYLPPAARVGHEPVTMRLGRVALVPVTEVRRRAEAVEDVAGRLRAAEELRRERMTRMAWLERKPVAPLPYEERRKPPTRPVVEPVAGRAGAPVIVSYAPAPPVVARTSGTEFARLLK